MEERLVEYRPVGSGLDYHHNSPLIGEIPPVGGELSHVVHRSIDQLRNSLSERGSISAFANAVELRDNILTYSNQTHSLHHQQQSYHIQQQQYELQTSVNNSNDDNKTNSNSIHRTNEEQQIIVQAQQQKTDHKQSTNVVCLNNNSNTRKSVNLTSSSTTTLGHTRGRKARIYLNTNQHIVVTSNSVDNSSTRLIRGALNDSNGTTNANDIISTNSSPTDLQQGFDVKDSKIFSSKADLQLHTQIHMREAKPYKCTQCSKAFANSSYLSQHTRIHLGIKPYRCEICQRKFTQLSHLQQHIRTHTGDKPYKCRHQGCQKAFSQLSNLQSHSRCHQTDKPFKCNSCYKCFSDEPSLLEHIPKHKESKHLKTHICQYCGKSYTQETYLTKHMQKHSERTDKRPPILSNSSGSNGDSGSNNNHCLTVDGGNLSNINHNGPELHQSTQHNRNISVLTPVSIAPTEHSYWPKISPDSAANMSDVIHQQQHHQHQQQQQQQQQQQPQQQQHQHQQQQTIHVAPPHQHQHHQQQQSIQQQHMDFPVINALQPTGEGSTNGHSDLQSINRMSENGRDGVVTTPTTIGPYDAANITKTTSHSAFTPINSMPSHLNTLSHHSISQRPYLYDAISFPNKNVNQANTSSFPNQLISLHQIRNYAHQPTNLMTSDHLLGVSVGSGKEKG